MSSELLPERLLKVALPVPLRHLFDYKPLPGLLPKVGCRCLVPFGKRELVGIVMGMGAPSDNYDPEKLQSIRKVLDPSPLLPSTLTTLCQRAADYYQQPVGEMLATALPVLLRQGKSPDTTSDTVWCVSEKGQHVLPEQFRQAHRQLQAWETLKQHPHGLTDAALRALGVQRSALAGLATKGWAEESRNTHHEDRPLLAEPAMSANDEQQAAIDAICQTTDFKGFLLDGITGSGKTEVYLQATAHVLEAGKQVLVLVPEIGLTPQTLERFRNRFNRRLDCLHSGLTDPQRLAAWEAARLGQTAIVMGTRSALFTPLPHLGLIIVDEAHDASYKQQDGCRYHARDLALWRGQLENVPVLLGSATPALESLHLCRQRKLVSLPLRQRAGGALPPAMQLLDCHSLPSMQLLHPISIAASQRCLEEGQQVLLFLNRRGYAPLINCFKCGWQMECSRCNRFMTWHKHIERLVCHHCGNQKPVPRHCPTCGSSELGDLGAGTEKLEEYVQSIFPDHAVIRIDRDATRRKGSLEASLARIQTGGPALLVGTQMLAKGHHFPNLALTVILDADAGFLSADFRGAEQAGATILQVAGRTGRTGRAGQVLVQTRHPQMPLLQCITQGDWHAFADLILEERNQMGLPPFTHAALLTAEATRAEAAMAFLQLATNQLSNESYVTRLGPAPAPMEKRAGRYRFQMLLLSPHRPALQNALQRLLAGIESKPEARRCRWSVDVDPQDML